jgi:hypothetical protein
MLKNERAVLLAVYSLVVGQLPWSSAAVLHARVERAPGDLALFIELAAVVQPDKVFLR